MKTSLCVSVFFFTDTTHPLGIPGTAGVGLQQLANSRMIHYQELLSKIPWVQVEIVRTLNPTSFYPQKQEPQS